MINQNSQFSENTPFEMDFDQSVININIGSHPDNDIVLNGAGVRPFHVSLVLQEGECQVIPLDADAEVRLDGGLVDVAQFKLNGAARRLDLGGNTLFIEHNKTFDSLHIRINPAASSPLPIESKAKDASQVASAVSSAADSAIVLNLFSQTDEVEVGQTATYQLQIWNAGPLVASFKVLVDGVPREWMSISPEEINLNEGERKQVVVSITPPRHPDSVAGQHDLMVSVSSPNYPGHQLTKSIPLHIKPYYEFSLGNLSPRDQKVYHWLRNRRMGNTILPITNLGNCPADFAISAADDENGCSFDFVLADELRLNRQATLHIPSGETLLQPIEINPQKRPWYLSNKRYSYTTTVQVTNQSIAPQMMSGSLTSHIPLWIIPVVIGLMLIGAFFLFQPRLKYFQADKNIILLNERTTLKGEILWFTDRVSISPRGSVGQDASQPQSNSRPLTNNQFSLTVAPTQTTTYDLVAGNLLSGLVHWGDVLESTTVLVVPPSPKIDIFSVDYVRVPLGKPINVSWSVQADRAVLRAGDQVIDLSKEKLNGQQEVKLTEDALVTLEAESAGGKVLRSYFVHVDQPDIKIKKFIIWTAQSSATAHKNGVTKLAALSPAVSTQNDTPPDANFPDEYEELVCTGSDTPTILASCGVVFSQPYRELDKSEQVLVEWEVEGAEGNTIKIDPFPETLPAKGNRIYSPESTMPFTLTAKSGAVQAVHMLNVNVSTDSPPTAPKIDFYQAVPVALVGKGDVKLSWSVSGNWTRIQIIRSDGTIVDSDTDDTVTAQGFKSVTVSQSDTYILTAWNGSKALSATKALDITVSPTLAQIDMWVDGASPYPNPDRFWVGDKVTVSIGLGKPPKGKPDPTGTVMITDGSSSCSFTLPINTCDLFFKSPGYKQISASYAGDTIYSQGKSASFPKDTKILVSSPSINLSAQFYLTNNAGGPIGSPIDVTTRQFKITQKLFAVVTFKPSAGRALEDGDKMNLISYSICKQSVCGVELPANFIEVKNSVGTANILIPGFPGAGTYELRFYYRHLQNLFASKMLSQPGIQVSALSIYLTMPPAEDCVNDIPASVTCSFSYDPKKPAEFGFDIHQTVGGDYLDASMAKPTLILPNSSTPFWKVYDADTQTPFDCSIKTKTLTATTRSVYFLDCSTDLGGKALIRVNYSYDNAIAPNYLMGDSASFVREPFYLRPAGRTVITYNPPDYLVGQVISLTPNGALGLVDDKKIPSPIHNVTGRITFASNPSTPGLFGVVPGSSSCTASSSGDAIENIDIDNECKIFFKKAGIWNVLINFSGDENNSASLLNVTGINVNKEGRIIANWYANGEAKPWDDITTVNVEGTAPYSMTGKIVFSGPSQFSEKALDGAKLSIVMTGANSTCTLKPASTIIYIASSQQAAFSFLVTCPQYPSKLNLDVQFTDSASFGFASTSDSNRQILFADQTSVAGVYFAFDAVNNNKLNHYFNFDWNAANPSPRKIQLLYAGEIYKIHLMYQPIWIDLNNLGVPGCPNAAGSICATLDDLLDFIQYGDTKNAYRAINIAIPSSWVDKIVVNSGPCTIDNGKIVVPLGYRRSSNDPLALWQHVQLSSPAMSSANVGDYGFNDANPCTVTFTFNTDVKTPFGQKQTTVFSLSQDFTEPTTKINDFLIYYSAGENYETAGLTKLFVKATFNPPAPQTAPLAPFHTQVQIGSAVESVSMTLTPTKDNGRLPLTSNNWKDWFDVTYPSACMGPNGLVGTVNSNNTVTWTMTPAKTYPCAGKLKIVYKGNAYFGSQLLVSQDVEFKP